MICCIVKLICISPLVKITNGETLWQLFTCVSIVQKFFSCRTIMRKDVVAVEPRERVQRVMEILRGTSHHGFPVVEWIRPPLQGEHYPNYGHLRGLILKTQLITLLRHRVSQLKILLLKIRIFHDFCRSRVNGDYL